MNLIVISGNLGADPEPRVTKGGTHICKLRVACSERVKQGDGNFTDHTEWFNVVVFGKRGEWMGSNLSKGDKVTIRGKVRQTEFEHEGVRRNRTEVLADDVEVHFTGRKSREDGY